MAGKIKGTGGFGQWDTGTANQDIRASYANSGNTGNATAPGERNYRPYVRPSDRPDFTSAQIAAQRAARQPKRNTGRGARKGGRKTR